jgi:DegV family protein with EDD domain
MVQIVTDSTCDLEKSMLDEFNIAVIPLSVNLDGKVFRDGIDLSLDEMYRLVDKSGALPKTAAPTPGEFVDFFNQISGDIVFIGISSNSSATVQNARLAAADLPDKNIIIVDSLNLSSGLGIQVVEAAEMAKNGLPAQEIAEHINKFRTRVHNAFIVDTLDYLYMGGRCSALQNVMSSLLKIRPLIFMQPNGTLGVKKRIRGSREKALQVLLDDVREDAANIDSRRLFITYNRCDDDAAFLKQEIMKIIPAKEVFLTITGTVVASHCGPKTISIQYALLDRELNQP